MRKSILDEARMEHKSFMAFYKRSFSNGNYMKKTKRLLLSSTLLVVQYFASVVIKDIRFDVHIRGES